MTADFTLTVLGTSDLHGHALSYDYGTLAPYADGAGNRVGLAACATLIREERAKRGADTCLTLDAGDTIQGTPLSHYFARVAPVTEGGLHPMAAAMNAVGYDAAAVGNHEFNYGLEVVTAFEQQLDFPLLAANALDWHTGRPAFAPFVIRTLTPPAGPPVRVGILGLVTPGVAVWDRAQVEGRVRFEGIVEHAAALVPRMRAAGADVVVVSCHSGMDEHATSYGDRIPFPENASALLARHVPGIDAILVGHAHLEVPERIIHHERTGAPVLLSEPQCWGTRLSVMELDLHHDGAAWRVTGRRAHLRHASEAAEDETVRTAVTAAHSQVTAYLQEVVAVSTERMPSDRARAEASRVIDLVNHVQAQVVSCSLRGGEHAHLPVLSVTSPFNRASCVPQGEVTVADLSTVYIHESTLLGVLVTGAQVRSYLEHSLAYFRAVEAPGAVAIDDVTCAPTPQAPYGTPDYGYDVLGALDEPVAYDVDLSAPVGERCRSLTIGGRPLEDDAQVVLAVNSYRQAGGSDYPVVTEAPVVYDEGREVRDLLIAWARRAGRIDPADLAPTRWRLTVGGSPLTVQ